MSLLLSVTFESGLPFEPNHLIVVSGLSSVAGAATVAVYRDYGDGSTPEAVRGLDNVPVVGDSIDASDYESAFQKTSWSYVVYVYNSAGAQLATSTNGGWSSDVKTALVKGVVPMASALLQSVQQPALNLGVIVNEFPSYDIPGRVLGTYNVLGRKNPVVVSDAFGGRTGSFTLLMNSDLSAETLDTYNTLLTYNDVLLFQPFEPRFMFDDMYFRISDVGVARQGVPDADGGPMTFLLNIGFTEVDRPATSNVSVRIADWGDVKDNDGFTTWNDVLTGRTSWLDTLNRA